MKRAFSSDFIYSQQAGDEGRPRITEGAATLHAQRMKFPIRHINIKTRGNFGLIRRGHCGGRRGVFRN